MTSSNSFLNFKDLSSKTPKRNKNQKYYDCYEDEKVAEKAVELIYSNKINAKNAFDVNVSFLENLPKLLDNKEENTWHKTSSSLDASVKIFGYRVDSVHSDMFKFLGGLNRSTYEGGDNERNDVIDDEQKSKNVAEIRNSGFNINEKNIESNHEKLSLKTYDLEFEYDPLFMKITEKFSNLGAKSLILKSQPMDCNLDILLESFPGSLDYYSDIYSNKDDSFTHNWNKIFSNCKIDQDLLEVEMFKNISDFIASKRLKEEKDYCFLNQLLHNNPTDIKIEKNDEIDNEFNQNEDLCECDTPKDLLSTDGDLRENTKDIFADFDLINKENSVMNHLNNNINNSNKKFCNNKFMFGEGNSNNIFKELNSKNFKNPDSQKSMKEINATITKVKKEKKEEILFKFSKESTVKEEEIFIEKSSKKEKTIRNKKKKKKYIMKTPMFYNFQQEYMLRYWFEFDYYLLKGGMKYQENQMDEERMNCDDLGNNPEQKYINQLENLYRKFDIKSIKEKMWELCSLENQKNEIVFSHILSEMEHKSSEHMNLSVSTCFVCLLHLANEKKSKDENIYINFNNLY